MQFLEMQQELADRLVAYDENVSEDATKLKRWLNMAQQYICGKKTYWNFMLSEEGITTVPDYTTGTITGTAGNNFVTVSSSIATSQAGNFIQFSSSNDWYKITTHTAATTILGISPVLLTNQAASTFKIRKLLYTPTSMMQILDMKQLVTPVSLISQSPRYADYFLPLYYGTGSPYMYILSTPYTTGAPQFSLLPSPSTAINLMVRGVKVLSNMVSDTDSSLIPVPWHDAMINIGAYYGFQGLDDTRAATELQIGEARIADMAKVYVGDLGRHRVMQPVDNNSNFGLQWALPSEFGPSV